MLINVLIIVSAVFFILLITATIVMIKNRRLPENRVTLTYMVIGAIACVLYGFMLNLFVNPAYFNALVRLDFTNPQFQPFLIVWLWRAPFFFFITTVSLRWALRSARKWRRKKRIFAFLKWHALLISSAWWTDFELFVLTGKSGVDLPHVLHWLGGFVACFMLILLEYVYIERKIVEYLDIRENYYKIRTRLLTTVLGIAGLLLASLFGILAGCLGVDAPALILFKLAVFAVLFVIPLLIIILKITRQFSDSLAGAAYFLKCASDRDFTVAVSTESRDEFGELEHSIGVLKDNLVGFIEAARSASEDVERSALHVEESMAEFNSGIGRLFDELSREARNQREITGMAGLKVEDMDKKINAIADHIGKQARLVDENSGAIEEMTRNIESITEKTRRASDSSNELFNVSQEGVEQIGMMVQSINDIREASLRINEINSLIDDISEQTNLLAMNAAIEASHAGEAGRGFAIVAGEMRTLAENARRNVESINLQLNEITSKIGKSTELSGKSRESLKRIAGYIEGNREVNSDIAASMEQQSQSLKNILGATSRLVEITGSVTESAKLLGDAGRDIKGTLDELNRLAEAETGAVQDSSDNVAKTVNEMNSVTGSNRKISEGLMRLIMSFKLGGGKQNE